MHCYSIILALFVLVLIPHQGFSQSSDELSFTTFNLLHYGLRGRLHHLSKDEYRAAKIKNFMKDENLLTDVIAFQEIANPKDLQDNVLGEDYLCHTYPHTEGLHEQVALCHRKEYELVAALGDDNFILESIALGNHNLRPAIHGVLRRPGKCPLVHVFNVHLKAAMGHDHERIEQMSRLISYIKQGTLHQNSTIPVVILGDFNTVDAKEVETFQQMFDSAGLDIRLLNTSSTSTFRDGDLTGKLDLIWASRSLSIASIPKVVGPCDTRGDDRESRRTRSSYLKRISDHCPVTVKLEIP